MSRNKKILLVVGAVVVLAGAGVVALLVTGGDGPEELTFDDATTTAQAGETTSTSSVVDESLDGAWVAGPGSQAGYRVMEDRLGGAANLEAVGRTDQVTGGFTVFGNTVTDVSFTVDVASIASDSGIRDGWFRSSLMEVDEFPTATFTTDTITVDEVPADGAVITVPVAGQLTLHGVTNDVTTDLEVKRAGAEVQILGTIPVLFSDYGIQTPSPPGLSVSDNGVVEFLVVATKA